MSGLLSPDASRGPRPGALFSPLPGVPTPYLPRCPHLKLPRPTPPSSEQPRPVALPPASAQARPGALPSSLDANAAQCLLMPHEMLRGKPCLCSRRQAQGCPRPPCGVRETSGPTKDIDVYGICVAYPCHRLTARPQPCKLAPHSCPASASGWCCSLMNLLTGNTASPVLPAKLRCYRSVCVCDSV